MVSVPDCAPWCPAIDMFVTAEARRSGQPEGAVREATGVAQVARDQAAGLRRLLDRMPPTADARGWLDAQLHHLDQQTGPIP